MFGLSSHPVLNDLLFIELIQYSQETQNSEETQKQNSYSSPCCSIGRYRMFCYLLFNKKLILNSATPLQSLENQQEWPLTERSTLESSWTPSTEKRLSQSLRPLPKSTTRSLPTRSLSTSQDPTHSRRRSSPTRNNRLDHRRWLLRWWKTLTWSLRRHFYSGLTEVFLKVAHKAALRIRFDGLFQNMLIYYNPIIFYYIVFINYIELTIRFYY